MTGGINYLEFCVLFHNWHMKYYSAYPICQHTPHALWEISRVTVSTRHQLSKSIDGLDVIIDK